MSISVIAEITKLSSLSKDELHNKWVELFQSDPPTYNKAFLIKRIAYRYQEIAFGGLSRTIKDQLEHYSEHYCKNGHTRVAIHALPESPLPGTELFREFKGVMHKVITLKDGYEYMGCKYKTLSAAARAITGGVRVSGPVFFGLKRSQGTKHEK